MYQFHLQSLEVVYFQPLKVELIHGSETSGLFPSSGWKTISRSFYHWNLMI